MARCNATNQPTNQPTQVLDEYINITNALYILALGPSGIEREPDKHSALGNCASVHYTTPIGADEGVAWAPTKMMKPICKSRCR